MISPDLTRIFIPNFVEKKHYDDIVEAYHRIPQLSNLRHNDYD